eukprot:1576079-Lingulodinium_polyedra.AAC.1
MDEQTLVGINNVVASMAEPRTTPATKAPIGETSHLVSVQPGRHGVLSKRESNDRRFIIVNL